MEWRPAGWSMYLPLLIFPCTIKSRSSLLAPAHPGGPGKGAVKWLWCGVVSRYSRDAFNGATGMCVCVLEVYHSTAESVGVSLTYQGLGSFSPQRSWLSKMLLIPRDHPSDHPREPRPYPWAATTCMNQDLMVRQDVPSQPVPLWLTRTPLTERTYLVSQDGSGLPWWSWHTRLVMELWL